MQGRSQTFDRGGQRGVNRKCFNKNFLLKILIGASEKFAEILENFQ